MVHTRSQTKQCAAPFYTDITMVVDMSGSMGSIGSSLVDGVREFLEQHAEQASGLDRYHLTLITFGSESMTLYSGPASRLNDKIRGICSAIKPNGCTKLYDSVSDALTSQANRIDDVYQTMPSVVKRLCPIVASVMALLTDGYDNRSELCAGDINLMINEHIERYDTNCQFIAANQSAKYNGEEMGFSADRCLQMDANPHHAMEAFRSMTQSTMRTVSGDVGGFTPDERMASSQTPYFDDQQHSMSSLSMRA